MRVREIISEERLLPVFGGATPFYERKFASLAGRTRVADRSIDVHWPIIRHQLMRKSSFNLWGVLWGPIWAIYRRLPFAWLWWLAFLSYGCFHLYVGLDNPWPLRAFQISGVVIYGMFGNNQVFLKYVGQFRSNPDAINIADALRPSTPSLLLLFPGLVAVFAAAVLNKVPADQVSTMALSVIQDFGSEKVEREQVTSSDVSEGPSEPYPEVVRTSFVRNCSASFNQTVDPRASIDPTSFCECMIEKISQTIPLEQYLDAERSMILGAANTESNGISRVMDDVGNRCMADQGWNG